MAWKTIRGKPVFIPDKIPNKGTPEEILNRLRSNVEPQTGIRRHDIILKKDAMEKFRIEPEKEFTIGGHVGIKNGLPDVGGEVKFTIRKF